MNKFANSSEILTGKTRAHLEPLPYSLSAHHFLQKAAVHDFLALQKAAKRAGFNLQAASTFRDFERQKLIWNTKFKAERKVHDDNGNAIDLRLLDDWQKCQAILRWSAMPGASRHHWGTEVDIFDPDLLPKDKTLQLEPWEYQTGGYFQQLTNWLLVNAEQFGFSFPFLDCTDKKIGLEPWHISYFPLSDNYERLLSPDILQQAWENEDIAGKATLIAHLDTIFQHYIL